MAGRPLIVVTALLVAALAVVGLAVGHVGVPRLLGALAGVEPRWLGLACGLMLAALVLRGISWLAVLRAALPGVLVPVAPVLRATMIGVMVSATLPARAGEAARAVVLAPHLGSVRRSVAVLAGTILSQTLLNLVALVALGAAVIASTGLLGPSAAVLGLVGVPLGLVLAVLCSPAMLEAAATRGPDWSRRAARRLSRELRNVRAGLRVFVHAGHGIVAALAQFGAWAIQVAACYAVLRALGLAHPVGVIGAAAVLVAVNVTAVVPVTPSNVGVFQAACAAVLAGFGVAGARGLAYGIVLQGVEVIAAVAAGLPALAREGLSWSDVRRSRPDAED